MPLHDVSPNATQDALICALIATGAIAAFDTQTILGGGSIPQGFNHLRVLMYLRGDDSAANCQPDIQFNGDTGSNYDYAGLLATASSTLNATGNAGQTKVTTGRVPAATAAASRFGLTVLDIPMYAGTTGMKVFSYVSFENRNTTTGDIVYESGGGGWRSTAAITRIRVTDDNGGNWVTGSAFYLYGII